ncbi:tetratricopeptide repeat protein [Thalassoroseus pseudoceratinae]|uniref:tetratricopeptide repeat protein n=1 Tax=Thalassoroseus pseudoceratinae TaxID=2713176 RepID=UPI001420B6C3|nr:tetratricopeptide repeat protein [Thalassoroseus pseudoceratinae]
MGQAVRWQCPVCSQWFLIASTSKQPRACSRCRQGTSRGSATNPPPAISTQSDFDSILNQAETVEPSTLQKSPTSPTNPKRGASAEKDVSNEGQRHVVGWVVGLGGGVLATLLLVLGVLAFQADEGNSDTAKTPSTTPATNPPLAVAKSSAVPMEVAAKTPVTLPEIPENAGGLSPTRPPVPVEPPSPAPKPSPLERQTPMPVSPPMNEKPRNTPADSNVADGSNNVPSPMPTEVASAPHGNGVLPIGVAAPDLVSTDAEKAKLKEIDSKREALVQKRSELIDQIAELNGEAAEHQSTLKQCQAETTTLNNNLNLIKAQLAGVNNQLQQQRITLQQKALLEQQGRALVAQGQSTSLAIQKVNAEAVATQTKLKVVSGRLLTRQRELGGLKQQADRLRDEWLKVTDPFGKLDRGQGVAAIAVLNQLISIQKDFVQAYVARGLAHYSLKHYDLAIKDFDEALRLRPNYPEALAGRALALSVGVSRTQGRLVFRDAVRYGKDSWFVYLCYGLAEQEHRDYGKAMAQFQKAAKLGSSEPAAFHYLGRLQAACPDAEWRDGQKALEAATKANSLSEGKVWVYVDTLAAAYAEQGEFNMAVQFQKDALALAPSPAVDACKKRLQRYEEGQPFRLP